MNFYEEISQKTIQGRRENAEHAQKRIDSMVEEVKKSIIDKAESGCCSIEFRFNHISNAKALFRRLTRDDDFDGFHILRNDHTLKISWQTRN